MSLHYPFQKICSIEILGQQEVLLLAASGPEISSFSTTGSLLFKWPRDVGEELSNESELKEGGERPSKRPRLSNDLTDSEESIEIIAERAKGSRRKPKVVNTKLPNVSHLLATSRQEQVSVIAVTTDDKCIRVFNVSKSGRLKVTSERSMPKRLCAITLTSDEQTIIAGDKFGDVYSLPIHPPASSSTPRVPKQQPEFKPSATEFTVHTKGNLEALRQQREQHKFKPKKEAPDFEHKLLLGHVSLLTDVAIAEAPVCGKTRQFILSADRDEHIRVSRGIPQTHIVEGYCHGHRDFVSKLCVMPWQPSLLVVGSGEPTLKVYDWRDSKLLSTLRYDDKVQQALSEREDPPKTPRSLEQPAISNLWTSGDHHILAAVEGYPILLSLTLTSSGVLAYHQTLHLSGNALDLTTMSQNTFLVSVDTAHAPGSVIDVRSTPPTRYIHAFTLQPGASGLTSTWQEDAHFSHITSTTAFDASEEGSKKQRPNAVYSPLGEFLYGLENLRKKRGKEEAEAAAGDGEGEGEE